MIEEEDYESQAWMLFRALFETAEATAKENAQLWAESPSLLQPPLR